MTKAQRIFNDLYLKCRLDVRNNSAKAYARVSDEVTCIRTLNEIQKLVNRELRVLRSDLELFGADDEYTLMCLKAVEMVQKTLDNDTASKKA